MRDPYFDIPAISNSDLKHFKRSPEHYKQYKRAGQPETEAMTFGSAFHCYVLENDKFKDQYSVLDESLKPVPGKDYRTVANKEWKDKFYSDSLLQGKTVLSPDELERIKAMSDKLYSVDPSKELLEYTRNKYEQTLEWKWHGINCKGKCDIINDFCLVDLKTTENADPVEFAKTVIWNEYYRQAGMYLDGDSGGKINYNAKKDFYFIAIEKSPPYGVSVHICSKELVEKGVEEYRSLVEQYKACFKNDLWESYQYKALSRFDGVFELDLPYYLKD